MDQGLSVMLDVVMRGLESRSERDEDMSIYMGWVKV